MTDERNSQRVGVQFNADVHFNDSSGVRVCEKEENPEVKKDIVGFRVSPGQKALIEALAAISQSSGPARKHGDTSRFLREGAALLMFFFKYRSSLIQHRDEILELLKDSPADRNYSIDLPEVSDDDVSGFLKKIL